MVRKSTRSSAKTAEKEKAKNESPKRTRSRASKQQKRSDSRSDESDEDVSKDVTKNMSPRQGNKESSDNESDKDSKKPLKKRSRSMAIKEEAQSISHKSRWDKQPKSPPHKTSPPDNDEEVKEDQNSKGKSKNKNNSNNDNVVSPEIENENVQVTDESPNDAKDDNHETEVKNGEENVEIGVDITKDSDTEKTSNLESSEVSAEPNVKEVSQDIIPGAVLETTSAESTDKETVDISTDKEERSGRRDAKEESSEVPKDSESGNNDNVNEAARSTRPSERSPTKESVPQNAESNHGETVEDSRKIKLKRPPIEKRSSESEKDSRRGENGVKKKITLKRPENKQHLMEESKPQVENQGVLSKEQTQSEDWTSSYEANNDNVDKQQKTEAKPIRKRITLKRSTVEGDKPSVQEKKDISVGRSISLQDHKEERRKSINENSTIEVKRRRSSAIDRSTSESEDKSDPPKIPSKLSKPIKLNRHLPDDLQEPPPPGEETVKKYKWGQSDISLIPTETVSLGALKQVLPTIDFLKEEEINLEIVPKETKLPNKERRKTFTELEEEEMENIEAELNAEPEEIEIKENIIAMNRKISIVDDTASKLKPPPSPARNPVSEVLFITNLVRPFTVKQLKELLERTGKINEDGFWTDRIKSKCYVCYEKIEEAEATRNALHGVNWPIGNGKKLIIDFATPEDLENAKNPPVLIKKEKSPEKENKKPIVEVEKDEKASRSVKREWDVDKEDEHRRRRSRTRSRERQRKHSRRSYTPEDYHGKKRKHEEPPPQKAMDDLFLKTKATPSIYWQPLSPEEIAMKQQQRQARLAENKRRLEEISRTTSRAPHRDRDRDRPFRRR